jgi:hypothetical protein
LRCGFIQVMGNGIVNVLRRQRSRHDRLNGHLPELVLVDWRTRSRSPSK